MSGGCKGFLAGLAMLFSGIASAVDTPPMDCVIEPNQVVDLSSAVVGVVQQMLVDRGDTVEEGQILVRLDAGVEEAALEYARARAAANAQVQAQKVNADFTQRRKDRLATLYQQKVLSSDQMDESSTDARLKQLQLQEASEAKRLAELDMRQAAEVLKRHVIRSPVRGVVVQRYLSPGESVEQKPILRLAQIDPLRAEVIIPVGYFGSIKVGQQAIVVPEAPKTGRYPATVTVVDRVADAASGTFRARLALPNPDYALPSGLRCTVQFLAQGQTPSDVKAPAPPPPSRAAVVAAALGVPKTVGPPAAAPPAKTGSIVRN
jgi:RND family efflux transporter MFP subunit